MSEFYKTLHARAVEIATPEIPLATEPKLSVSPKLIDMGLNLRWDMDIIRAQAERHGKDAASLGTLAVYCFDGKYGAGGLHTEPLVVDDQIHYPVFGIGVDNPQSPDLAALNGRFRHEFRHVMQEDLSNPLYSRRWARVAVRMGAIPIALLGWKQNIDVISGDAHHGFIPALASFASSLTIPALAPYRTMWALTPREIDANYFAWRHKDFTPISQVTTQN
jgi:hypothetical protein